MLTWKRFGARLYLAHINERTNAVIKREGNSREWLARFTEVDTGATVRFAGVWNKLSDAKEEIEHVAATF